MAPLVIPASGTTSNTILESVQLPIDPATPLSHLVNAANKPSHSPQLESNTSRTSQADIIKQKLKAFERLLKGREQLPQALDSAVARLLARANVFIEGPGSSDAIPAPAGQRTRTKSADQEFETIKDAFDTITVTLLETTRPIGAPRSA
ncbi:hypothetical protein ACM66B_005573 [Microbotryomycetes sp. NB124-2]